MTDLYMYMYWLLPLLWFTFLFVVGDEKIDGKVEYTITQWVTMLFGTGMATGLIYWSLPETAYHMMDNPLGKVDVAEATAITWYHWTYNAWMLYTAFAVVVYKFMKWAPLIVQKVAFGILAISALFGVLVDTGLAIFQLPDGNEYLNAFLLIGVAIASYFSGVKRGILRISQLAVVGALVFIGVLCWTYPGSMVRSFTDTAASYVDLVARGKFITLYEDTSWTESWTSFYSAWWYLWVAFVGVFIVRISKGRTIRDVLLVATIVPATMTAFWMSSFSALGNYYLTPEIIAGSPDDSIYTLMDTMFGTASNLSEVMKGIAIVLMYAFMLTSIDSGFYASEKMIGANNLWHRLVMVAFFAVSVVAILYIGDVSGVQTMALQTAAFGVITVLCMVIYVLRGMIHELWDSMKER